MLITYYFSYQADGPCLLEHSLGSSEGELDEKVIRQTLPPVPVAVTTGGKSWAEELVDISQSYFTYNLFRVGMGVEVTIVSISQISTLRLLVELLVQSHIVSRTGIPAEAFLLQIPCLLRQILVIKFQLD